MDENAITNGQSKKINWICCTLRVRNKMTTCGGGGGILWRPHSSLLADCLRVCLITSVYRRRTDVGYTPVSVIQKNWVFSAIMTIFTHKNVFWNDSKHWNVTAIDTHAHTHRPSAIPLVRSLARVPIDLQAGWSDRTSVCPAVVQPYRPGPARPRGAREISSAQERDAARRRFRMPPGEDGRSLLASFTLREFRTNLPLRT